LPTYSEMINGTPKLTWLFELSSTSATAESVTVRLRGLDWNTIEATIKKWKEVFQTISLPDAPDNLLLG
jgi:hypothetical protein